MSDITTTVDELATAARRAYFDLVNDAQPEVIYGALTALFADHGLDANIAESAVDWVEGSTLIEDLTDAVERAGVSIYYAEADEECDCADFANCSSCREWAEQMLADGCSPWNGLPIDDGETVEPLPPANF